MSKNSISGRAGRGGVWGYGLVGSLQAMEYNVGFLFQKDFSQQDT